MDSSIPTYGNAVNTYQGALNTAVGGLQTAKTDLATQYQQLLADTLGQGTVAMNTATSGENSYLGARGLLSQGGQGNNQLSAAQLAVQQANQAAVGSLGYQQGQLNVDLAGSIAGIQATGAGNIFSGAPNYAQMALIPSQIAENQAEASQYTTTGKYILGPNSNIFNTQTGMFETGAGTLPSGGQLVQKNGQWYWSLP